MGQRTLPQEVGLALLLVIACAPSLGFGFLQWDDPEHLTRNPLVLAPETVSLRQQLSTPGLGYPIPLTVASYRLQEALFGLNSSAFHAVSALLHATVAALAFRMARRVGLSAPGALLATLLFALHPASAECASWVTGQKDLLACAFGLCALHLSLRAGSRARASSVLCYGLALLSKPSFGPLALLVPALSARSPAESEEEPGSPLFPLRAAAVQLLPYLAVLVPVTVLGIQGQRAIGAVSDGDGGFAPMSRARAVWYAFGHHASLVLFAERPSVKYAPFPWPPAFPSTADWAGAALLALLALALVYCRGRATSRAARVGVGFATLSYLPTSGLLFPLARFLADSYVYLPLIGLGWTAGAAFDQCCGALGERMMRVLRVMPWLVGLTLLPSFMLSAARFHDDLALWEPARERYPHQPRICRQWANAVYARLGAEPGLGAVDRCIADVGPDLFHKNRGVLLAQLGRFAEARAWLLEAQKSAKSDPVIERYLREMPAAADAHR